MPKGKGGGGPPGHLDGGGGALHAAPAHAQVLATKGLGKIIIQPDMVAQHTQFETYYYATMIRDQMGRNLSRSDLRTKLAGN